MFIAVVYSKKKKKEKCTYSKYKTVNKQKKAKRSEEKQWSDRYSGRFRVTSSREHVIEEVIAIEFKNKTNKQKKKKTQIKLCKFILTPLLKVIHRI